MARPKGSSEARQRILETAARLFYREGVRAVGIDRVIAEAGVAKMTLYAHFPSKDELILAVLRYREESLAEFFREALERHRKKKADPLRAFFLALKELFSIEGFRGCAFQNAAAELADPNHEGTAFVRAQKKRFVDMLRNILVEAVGEAGAEAAPAVAMLVEGAIVNAVIHQSPEMADVAYEAALRLLAKP